MEEIQYKQTDWDLIYSGSDGEMYTSYYPGFTKKKAKIRKGLKVITIRVRGSKKYISVAKEIGKAFIPNPDKYRYIKEKDEDQMNTSPDNLYWSKNNRMDYKAFAKKKEGTFYKSYVDEIKGDYIVIKDDTKLCTLSCLSCGDIKTTERRNVNNTFVCLNCKEYSLDLTLLQSKYYKNWSILKENGTENIGNKSKKEILIECKCCNQEKIVKYPNFIKRKSIYLCDNVITKRILLNRKISMAKQRCYNEKDPSYKRYGGRGIKVCKKWREDSEAFISWALDNGFEIGLEIDREDNDGNYEPSNCRFVTREVNKRNQSSNILTKELVNKIKSTDWKNMDNRQIADELGFSKDRVRVGNTIAQVRRGNTWKNI